MFSNPQQIILVFLPSDWVFEQPAEIGITNPEHLGRIRNLVFPNAPNAVWKLLKGGPIRSRCIYILQEFAAQSQLRPPTITEILGKNNLGDSAFVVPVRRALATELPRAFT